MATINNEEDFITCGVCFLEYDEEIRKPKFLPCSHTFCLPCLQDIQRGDAITCPVCRKTICKDAGKEAEWILPNNTYALQMIKQKERGASSTSFPLESLQNIDMDALLEIKEELLKLRHTGMNKLALAIEKRQKVQQEMALIIEAINIAGEEAKKIENVNNLCLKELISISSTKPRTVHQNAQRKDEVISELFSTTNDSVETLKQKMKKLVEMYQQKLDEATAIASEYELRQKTKIRVYLCDENNHPIPTCPLLEEGLRYQPLCPPINGSENNNLLLLSHHTFFLLLQRLKIPSEGVQQSTSVVVQQPATSELFTSTSPPMGAMNSDSIYLCHSRKFILRFYRSDKLKSEIQIRPAPTFHPQFVKELAEFCHKSPKNLSYTIQKVMPGVFILIPMRHPQFQPVVRSMIKHGSTCHSCTAEDFDEVGITSVKNLAGKVIGWSFVFVLEDYENFHNRIDHLPKSIQNNEYFGDVIYRRGLAAVIQSSKDRKKSQQTSSFTFTLEYP